MKYPGDDLLTLSKNKDTSLGFFWYGFVTYLIFFVLASAETSFISPAACQGIQIIGLILMIMGGASLMNFKFDSEYLKNLFIFNLLYSATIVLRGSEYDFKSLKLMFLDVTFGILPYFASLVMLLPRNIANYKKIFHALLILSGAYLVSVVVFYDTLHDYDRLNLLSQGLVENVSTLLALPIGFLLLNYIYNGKIKNIYIVFVLMVTLFFAIFRARRGLIFMCLSTAMCVGMIYVISTKKKALIIVLAVVLLGAGAAFASIMKNPPAMFGFLLDRGDTDTRTGVEVYMYADMSPVDWVIGKGIKGQYYCPIVDNVNDAEGLGYRDNIETGYLQIILKGGIISLGLLLFMFVPAVYKGFFKSSNVLCKASSMWIFLWIVYLYPSGGIVFNMNYVLVWVAVGICYSDKIRNLSDQTIKAYLQK